MRADAQLRRWTLRSAGTVAVAAGMLQVVTGVAGVRGTDARSLRGLTPNVDSELRFYAAWYTASGVVMHRAAADARTDRALSPVLVGAWSLAGLSRLLSMRAVGRPSPELVLLAALELAVAGVLAATRDQSAAGHPARRRTTAAT